jgi:hypothetical protein
MDLLFEEDAKRKRKFTLYSRGQECAAFDTSNDVLAFVRAEPDRAYTIYLGEGVSLGSDEVEEIKKNWRRR